MPRMTRDEAIEKAERAEKQATILRLYLHDRENNLPPFATASEPVPGEEGLVVQGNLYRGVAPHGGYVVLRWVDERPQVQAEIGYLEEMEAAYAAHTSNAAWLAAAIVLERLRVERNRKLTVIEKIVS